MNLAKQLQAEMQRHEAEKTRLLTALQQQITSLPDNPAIQRCKTNPHCFVISFKELGLNWSVEHHDFVFQYREIAKQAQTANDPFKCLQRIAHAGFILIGHKPKYTVRLHPLVIKHINTLLTEETVNEILLTNICQSAKIVQSKNN